MGAFVNSGKQSRGELALEGLPLRGQVAMESCSHPSTLLVGFGRDALRLDVQAEAAGHRRQQPGYLFPVRFFGFASTSG